MPSDFDLSLYNSIIALNGNIPSSLPAFSDIPLIAADGASDKLLSMGIIPDIVIGDLDSLLAPSSKSQIIHIQNQNQCDFEKALHYCKSHHLFPALIIGVEGNELDHVLNNLALISQYQCDFYTSKLYGKTLFTDQTFTLKTSQKVSIFPTPSATVSTKGLTWNLTNQYLSFPSNMSLSNQVQDEYAEIKIINGHAIIFIHF